MSSNNIQIKGGFFQARQILKAMISDESKQIPTINSIRWHNRKETLKHYVTKCILGKVLMDAGNMVVSEFPIAGGECDVFDIFNRHVHELESKTNKNITQKKKDQYLGSESQVKDLFIWYLDDIPDDVQGMYDYFKERI